MSIYKQANVYRQVNWVSWVEEADRKHHCQLLHQCSHFPLSFHACIHVCIHIYMHTYHLRIKFMLYALSKVYRVSDSCIYIFSTSRKLMEGQAWIIPSNPQYSLPSCHSLNCEHVPELHPGTFQGLRQMVIQPIWALQWLEFSNSCSSLFRCQTIWPVESSSLRWAKICLLQRVPVHPSPVLHSFREQVNAPAMGQHTNTWR